ncbi:MAG: TetR/AcrR family transcriptional regulator [Actinomycetota bacterium]|nr:TetR/AcrR family transcriptional regulator [Actinomycetota bacterium]
MPLRPELTRSDAMRNSERILAAARAVFARSGLDASLDGVAREAGVGVATVYRRFADKEALIDALFETKIGAIVALAEEGVAHPDPWQGVCRFVMGAGSELAADRGLMTIVLSAAHGRVATERARNRIGPAVAKLVARGIDSGVLRPEMTTADFPMMQILLAGVIDASREVAPQLWRRYATLILDAIRADGVPRPPLEEPALRMDDVDAVMHCWQPGRRPGAEP